jgi:hypothetical protein
VERKTLEKAGLVALAALAPGGLILGGLWALRAYRQRQAAKTDESDAAGA